MPPPPPPLTQARSYTMVYSGVVPWAEVEPLFLQALALHREVLGPDNLATLRLIYGLGLGYDFNFQPAKAAPLVADALERSRSTRALGEQHPQTAGLMSLLGHTYSYLN